LANIHNQISLNVSQSEKINKKKRKTINTCVNVEQQFGIAGPLGFPSREKTAVKIFPLLQQGPALEKINELCSSCGVVARLNVLTIFEVSATSCWNTMECE
jgi:hypothetical protein